jgi:phosphate transport system permease protein
VSHPFTKTRSHPFERLAEWTIRIVASISILMICLIFLFVFRETLSLFTTNDTAPTEHVDETTAVVDGSILIPDDPDRPEVYNPMPGEVSTRTGLVKVGGRTIFIPVSTDLPEVYNPDTGALPEEVASAAASADAPSLWTNLTSNVWQPIGEQPKFGIVPLLIGTLKTTVIAILIGGPLGILAALYTAFFASRRLRQIIKPAIELLAGFPSVVIGFFCLVTVASFIQDTFDTEFRLNALVGGIGLSLAVVPIVYSIAEDALAAVPRTLREASLALGSTEWQTAYRVMLPAAAPGVMAALILGIGRAFGETMIAIMATGNAPLMSWSGLTPARTFAATIGSEMGEVVWGSEHYGILFLLGALLFVVSFSLNALTELYVKKRLIKKIQGR